MPSIRQECALALLDDVLGELKEPGILGLSEALLVLGDQIPNEQRGFFNIGTDFQILGLEYRALIKLEESKRCDWLQGQISNGQSFYTVIRLIAMDDHEEGKPREHPLVDEACLDGLKGKCVQAIIARAQQGQLSTVKGLAFILVYWQRWAKDREPLDVFVAQQTSTQDSLIDFVWNFVQQGQSTIIGDYVSRSFWNVDLNVLELFISRERLSALISSFTDDDIEQMPESRKTTIRTLRDALKKNGAAEDGFEGGN